MTRHSLSQGSVNGQIRILKICCQHGCRMKWQTSEGLQFVQLIKTQVYDSGIKRSYYKPLFECSVKVG